MQELAVATADLAHLRAIEERACTTVYFLSTAARCEALAEALLAVAPAGPAFAALEQLTLSFNRIGTVGMAALARAGARFATQPLRGPACAVARSSI